jgi:hypothetical protein
MLLKSIATLLLSWPRDDNVADTESCKLSGLGYVEWYGLVLRPRRPGLACSSTKASAACYAGLFHRQLLGQLETCLEQL